jgi:hypothetical protein
MGRMVALILAVLLAPVGADAQGIEAACHCEGCGCKGGPGWRVRTVPPQQRGHCVFHNDLARLCGDPPSSAKCDFEGARQVCPSERRCGSKGGSGWRDKDGRCVPRNQLKRTCGDPPSPASCTFEGDEKPAPGA